MVRPRLWLHFPSSPFPGDPLLTPPSSSSLLPSTVSATAQGRRSLLQTHQQLTTWDPRGLRTSPTQPTSAPALHSHPSLPEAPHSCPFHSPTSCPPQGLCTSSPHHPEGSHHLSLRIPSSGMPPPLLFLNWAVPSCPSVPAPAAFSQSAVIHAWCADRSGVCLLCRTGWSISSEHPAGAH